jgi:rhodanese-related sulfurtransferase
MMITGFCRTSRAGGLVVFATLAMLQSSLFAAEKSSPGNLTSTVAAAITIDSEHLIELYQSVPGLLIIDSRLRQDHALGHIEKSSSLPLNETNCKSLSTLAPDSDQAIVFYCNGSASGSGADVSTEAVHIASNCGYKRLFWLRGGFIEWQDKDYPFVIEHVKEPCYPMFKLTAFHETEANCIKAWNLFNKTHAR